MSTEPPVGEKICKEERYFKKLWKPRQLLTRSQMNIFTRQTQLLAFAHPGRCYSNCNSLALPWLFQQLQPVLCKRYAELWHRVIEATSDLFWYINHSKLFLFLVLSIPTSIKCISWVDFTLRILQEKERERKKIML